MTRFLRYWFCRLTGSLEAQIARRMRQERESLHWWDVPEQEPEASPLDFWDGCGVPRQQMAEVLREARERTEHGKVGR